METPLSELRKVAGGPLRGRPDTAPAGATVCLYVDLADPGTRSGPRGGRPGSRSSKQTTRRSALRLRRLFRILAEDAAYVNDGVATFRVLVRERGRRFYLRSPQKEPGDGLQDTDVVFLVALGLIRWTRNEEFAPRWALNQAPHLKAAVLEAMARPATDGTLSEAILDAALTLPTELTDGIDAFQSWRSRQKLPRIPDKRSTSEIPDAAKQVGSRPRLRPTGSQIDANQTPKVVSDLSCSARASTSRAYRLTWRSGLHPTRSSPATTNTAKPTMAPKVRAALSGASRATATTPMIIVGIQRSTQLRH
jgi:hypothetical protein